MPAASPICSHRATTTRAAGPTAIWNAYGCTGNPRDGKAATGIWDVTLPYGWATLHCSVWTAEDKLDTNPLFANLFNSRAYREAQVAWLADALKRPEIRKAPFKVALCHIPLYDANPKANPGDVAPADKAPQYTHDFAIWQRTCKNLWSPLLEKAGCQLLVTAHEHAFRIDEPNEEHAWTQIVGGGPDTDKKDRHHFPTVIEGEVQNGKLRIRVHDVLHEEVVAELTFDKNRQHTQKPR